MHVSGKLSLLWFGFIQLLVSDAFKTMQHGLSGSINRNDISSGLVSLTLNLRKETKQNRLLDSSHHRMFRRRTSPLYDTIQDDSILLDSKLDVMPSLEAVSPPELTETTEPPSLVLRDVVDVNNNHTSNITIEQIANTSLRITTIPESPPKLSKERHPFIKALAENWLVLGEIFVIILAKQYPHLGATGGPLKPEFYISKLGVFTIFFINGVALSLSGGGDELAAQTKTNLLIQGFNFGFIPVFVKLFARFYPDPAFRDGLLVLACLPTTINICVAQTLSAGANMGTAIFNAIFANVLGVFVTPLLAIWLLGAGRGVSLFSTLGKLGYVVILPLVVGQIVRRTPLGAFFQRINKYSRTLSSCLLLAIVYNVFSDTFMSGIGVGGSALARLIIAMPLFYLFFSWIFWKLSFILLPGLDMSTRSAALLCSSQKTLAFGIPFIKTALGTRPDLAYILAPLLMYAPAQLLLGSSVLVPPLKKKIQEEQEFESGGGI